MLTLFAMDMDRLKMINDVYGHQEGDYAIQCLAKALEQVTAEKGICARYGGDEFAFALLDREPLDGKTEEIRQEIEEKARSICGEKEYQISASIGATACPVAECVSLDQILAKADGALYADKSKRGGRRKEDRGGYDGK